MPLRTAFLVLLASAATRGNCGFPSPSARRGGDREAAVASVLGCVRFGRCRGACEAARRSRRDRETRNGETADQERHRRRRGPSAKPAFADVERRGYVVHRKPQAAALRANVRLGVPSFNATHPGNHRVRQQTRIQYAELSSLPSLHRLRGITHAVTNTRQRDHRRNRSGRARSSASRGRSRAHRGAARAAGAEESREPARLETHRTRDGRDQNRALVHPRAAHRDRPRTRAGPDAGRDDGRSGRSGTSPDRRADRCEIPARDGTRGDENPYRPRRRVQTSRLRKLVVLHGARTGAARARTRVPRAREPARRRTRRSGDGAAVLSRDPDARSTRVRILRRSDEFGQDACRDRGAQGRR